MKFPVIDFIDIIVDDLNSNNIKIQSLSNVMGVLNGQKFFKSSILPEISVEEYAQIIFGVFFKIKNNYSNENLEKMFKNITLIIWCDTSYDDYKQKTCDECYGSGASTCSKCSGIRAVECPECDGTGSVDDDEGEVTCDNCSGVGIITCDNCGGDGDVYCDNCGGDGEVQGDEYFDYSMQLIAALMNKNEYKTLYTYKSHDDPDSIDIVNNAKYLVDIYEYSGTLEDGDPLFMSGDVKSQSNYFLGLLDEYKKNDKYSNFRIGTIEEYM